MTNFFNIVDTLSQSGLFWDAVIGLSFVVAIITFCILKHEKYKSSELIKHVMRQSSNKYVYYISILGMWIQTVWFLINGINTKSLIDFLVTNCFIISPIIISTYDNVQDLIIWPDLGSSILFCLEGLSINLCISSFFYKLSFEAKECIFWCNIIFGPLTIIFGILIINFLLLIFTIIVAKNDKDSE